MVKQRCLQKGRFWLRHSYRGCWTEWKGLCRWPTGYRGKSVGRLCSSALSCHNKLPTLLHPYTLAYSSAANLCTSVRRTEDALSCASIASLGGIEHSRSPEEARFSQSVFVCHAAFSTGAKYPSLAFSVIFFDLTRH